eukprot:c25217_g2_i1 orf=2-412(-)
MWMRFWITSRGGVTKECSQQGHGFHCYCMQMIVLISDSPEGMQRHLDTLHTLASDSGLLVNLGKTKVMVFNTTPKWVRRSAPTFAYGEEMVEYIDAHTYLGVVFSDPMLSLRRAAKTRLTRAYVALGRMKRMCSQVQ